MKTPILLFHSPDPAPSPAPKKAPLPRAAFNREIAAELQEAGEIVLAAREAPYAAILADDYDVSAATVTQIETLASEAARKFGLAAGGAQSGIADTAAKQKLEDALDAAIRRIQTGARLTYPTSAPDQKRWGIGIDLENAEDQVELLVPQMLQQLETETLRSVKPEHIAAVKTAFDAWMAAGGAQQSGKLVSQQSRLEGTGLLKQMRPLVREVKICIDGEYPYDGTDENGAPFTTTRKKFHIPERQPYIYTPRAE